MKIITLHKADFENHCKRLFSKIDIQPDMVIGILNGGGFVLSEFKKTASEHTQFITVKSQRRSTKKLKKNIFIKNVLRFMPYTILDKVRLVEHEKAKKSKSFQHSNDISIHSNSDLKNIVHVLILDDALDSGNTMDSVLKSVNKKFPNAIVKTAVIAWTNPESNFTPDHYIFKNKLIRFHWSLDYKTKYNV